MSGVSIRLPPLLPALCLALLIPLSGCGEETGFLVNVEIDPTLEPGRDFDQIRVQITADSEKEPSGQGLTIENGMEGPYTFLILQGDTRRYTASATVLVSKEGMILPWGEKSEANWEFKQGEIVDKTIRFDALPQ